MGHFQQRISQITPFGNTNITAAQILHVNDISLILLKHSFHGYNTTYNPLMDLFYIYIVNN
jgi:hypothetical protein